MKQVQKMKIKIFSMLLAIVVVVAMGFANNILNIFISILQVTCRHQVRILSESQALV